MAKRLKCRSYPPQQAYSDPGQTPRAGIGKGGGALGFQRENEEGQYKRMQERVMEEAKKVFNPEFLNRVDEVLVFRRLTATELVAIVDIQVEEVLKRVAEKGAKLVLTDEAKELLVREGSNEEYGARPLRRAVQQMVEDPLAELLLKGALEPGTEIVVRPSELGTELVFEPAAPVAEGAVT